MISDIDYSDPDYLTEIRVQNCSDHLSSLPITLEPTDSQLILSLSYIVCITLTLCGHMTQFMIQVHHGRLHKYSHVQHFLAGFFIFNTIFSFGIPWMIIEVLIRHWTYSRYTCHFYQITAHIGRSVLPYIVVGMFAVTNISITRPAKNFDKHSMVSAMLLVTILSLILLCIVAPIMRETTPLIHLKMVQESLDKTSNMTYDIIQCDPAVGTNQYSFKIFLILIEVVIPIILCVFLAIQVNSHCKDPALYGIDPIYKLLIIIGLLHFTGNIMHYLPAQKTLSIIENNFPKLTYRHYFAILPYLSSSISWIPASYISEIWHKYETHNISPFLSRASGTSTRSVRFLISTPSRNQISVV